MENEILVPVLTFGFLMSASILGHIKRTKGLRNYIKKKNNMKETSCTLKMEKGKEGLKFLGESKKVFGDFTKDLKPGETISIYIERNINTGTTPQLAKIHASIRSLSIDIGSTFEETKLAIKHKSGLVVKGQAKSFADCSKEELMLVIETINQIGRDFNMHL